SGGWVPLIFHHVCGAGSCGLLSIQEDTFRAFVAWLAGRTGAGLAVRTVDQVIGGPQRPAVPVARARPHRAVNRSLEGAGPAGETSPSLETPDRSGAPKCWME